MIISVIATILHESKNEEGYYYEIMAGVTFVIEKNKLI